jgi:hypothetical protein
LRDATGGLRWAIGITLALLVAATVVLVVRDVSHTGSGSPSSQASAKRTASTTSTTLKTDLTPPHFTTPQAAMVYLAAAFNERNVVDLDHVTNPGARAQLNSMHSMAVDLKLDYCTRQPAGDYQCTFDHKYPSTDKTRGPDPGHAVFLVGPAATPGWYMTVYESCN